jgi:hypothetical protein
LCGCPWRDPTRFASHFAKPLLVGTFCEIAIAAERLQVAGVVGSAPADGGDVVEVLRRHAVRAQRQRTLEANGIDCGTGPSSERAALRRERCGSRSAERTGGLGEDRQVGV